MWATELPTITAELETADESMLLQLRWPGEAIDRLVRFEATPSAKDAVGVLQSPLSAQFGGGAPSQSDRDRQFEYKIVKSELSQSLENTLNSYGRQGWELISMAGMEGVTSFTGNKFYAVLKREI